MSRMFQISLVAIVSLSLTSVTSAGQAVSRPEVSRTSYERNSDGQGPTEKSKAPTSGKRKLAPLLDGLGDYKYPVSDCTGPAQRYFNQGLRLVYSFQYAEAVASFRETVRLDPNCPMAHWGIALAIAPNPNSLYAGAPADPQGAGQRAIARAVRLSDRASQKERGMIEALEILYDDNQSNSDDQIRAHTEAMRRLAEQFPEDPEILTQYGEALMMATPWDYWTPDGKPRPETEEAMAAFNHVLDDYPNHPGANHLYIHLVENSLDPEQAFPHARRLAETMPGSGHLAHMPSHIYIRTGQYTKAIESNYRSLEADAAMLDAWGDREIPLEVVSYTASAGVHGMHAHEFLHLAGLFQGNYATAIESARTVASLSEPMLEAGGIAKRSAVRGVVQPWLTQKRFGKWVEILEAPLPDSAHPFVAGIWHYVRGSAFTATGELRKAEQELAEVHRLAAKPGMDEFLVVINPARRLLTIAVHELAGEILAKRGEFRTAIAHLERATRIQDGLQYIEPPDWAIPVRHALGAVLLESGRPKEAEVVYWEDLRQHPENGWALYGVCQSLRRQGEEDRAAEVKERFRRAWEHADVTLTSSRF